MPCAFVYILGCQVLRPSHFLSLSDFPTLFWAHLTLIWLSGYLRPVNVPVCARSSPVPHQSCAFVVCYVAQEFFFGLNLLGNVFGSALILGFWPFCLPVCGLFAEKLLNFCEVWTALFASGSFSMEILTETLKMFPPLFPHQITTYTTPLISSTLLNNSVWQSIQD